MAVITTESMANPKPVRPIDWTGNPLAEGASYAGGDERFTDTPQKASPASVKASPTRRKRRGGFLSQEQREKARERMRRYWLRKRGTPSVVDSQSNVPAPDSPSVATESS